MTTTSATTTDKMRELTANDLKEVAGGINLGSAVAGATSGAVSGLPYPVEPVRTRTVCPATERECYVQPYVPV